jgi:predicted RNA polymerase sigma factor
MRFLPGRSWSRNGCNLADRIRQHHCEAHAQDVRITALGRIPALYDALAQLTPSPVIELNRAVAIAMAYGPAAGRELVDALGARKCIFVMALRRNIKSERPYR